jgi:hypothetical protein
MPTFLLLVADRCSDAPLIAARKIHGAGQSQWLVFYSEHVEPVSRNILTSKTDHRDVDRIGRRMYRQ